MAKFVSAVLMWENEPVSDCHHFIRVGLNREGMPPPWIDRTAPGNPEKQRFVLDYLLSITRGDSETVIYSWTGPSPDQETPMERNMT